MSLNNASEVTNLIDTHVHFDDDRFDHDRNIVYKNALDSGVTRLIVPATTRHRWQKIQSLCARHSQVYPTAGLHPAYIQQHKDSDLHDLPEALESGNCVAVGECGLDGFIKELDFNKQKRFFDQQLMIAAEIKLPVIVHARSAVQEVIQSIRTAGKNTTGVIHSYNGSLEQAKQLIELGYLLSFGGAITYDRATRLHKVVAELPLDTIMLETDAPDQTVSRNNGERNEPAYLTEVLDQMAKLKKISIKDMAISSNRNATSLFKLPPPVA